MIKPFNSRDSCEDALSNLPIEVSQRFALAAARLVAPDLQTIVILNVVEDYLDGKVDRATLETAKDIASAYAYASAASAAYAAASASAYATTASAAYASYAAASAAYAATAARFSTWDKLNEILEEVKDEYERRQK